MSKYLDKDGITYLWNKLSLNDYPNNETLIAVLNAIDETKVDKVEGKDLSTNDYTDIDKEKLDNIIDIPIWTIEDEAKILQIVNNTPAWINISNITEFINLATEVEDTKKSVSEGKALVAEALTAKNVPTSSTATFQKIADNITNNLRSADKYYRVQVGAYSSFTNAQNMLNRLIADGYQAVIVEPNA